MKNSWPLRYLAVAGFLFFAFPTNAEPVPVRYVRGYLHGFVVLKDLNDKILASGDLTQTPAGNRITTIFSLHFTDGSLYQETSLFSQRKIFQLISYKRILNLIYPGGVCKDDWVHDLPLLMNDTWTARNHQ